MQVPGDPQPLGGDRSGDLTVTVALQFRGLLLRGPLLTFALAPRVTSECGQAEQGGHDRDVRGALEPGANSTALASATSAAQLHRSPRVAADHASRAVASVSANPWVIGVATMIERIAGTVATRHATAGSVRRNASAA